MGIEDNKDYKPTPVSLAPPPGLRSGGGRIPECSRRPAEAHQISPSLQTQESPSLAMKE